MPHPKEHPLAGRRVVLDARIGEIIGVVDWLDRQFACRFLMHPSHPVGSGFKMRVAQLGLDESGAVLARSTAGLTLVHHAELPSYDPVPVGVIS